jgi:hypothetical protein
MLLRLPSVLVVVLERTARGTWKRPFFVRTATAWRR